MVSRCGEARAQIAWPAACLVAAASTLSACSSKDAGGSNPVPDAGSGSALAIGRAGGEIRNPDGSGVRVPADALQTPTTLEVAPYDGTLPRAPEGYELAGGAYAFTPHGTVFEHRVTIHLPYESSRLGKVVLFLEGPYDPQWGVLEEGPTYEKGIATLEVRTFSIYAVAHPADPTAVVCTEPLVACEGECVDLTSNARHCGACRSRCDTVCNNSVCEPPPPMDCAADADCDDGVFCNGAESCAGGLCQSNAAPACDDGDPLTADSCDDATQMCVSTPMDVDGGI